MDIMHLCREVLSYTLLFQSNSPAKPVKQLTCLQKPLWSQSIFGAMFRSKYKIDKNV